MIKNLDSFSHLIALIIIHLMFCSVAQVSEAISEETVKGSGVTRSSSEASTSSSPDILTEISRQALIRQPIIRKRRLHIN